MRLPASLNCREIEQLLMVWSEMIGEMFGGYTELRNAMWPEPGLDAKTSPAKTTRSRTEIEPGNEALGVCAKAFKTNARFPLTRPTSLEMCYSTFSAACEARVIGGAKRGSSQKNK